MRAGKFIASFIMVVVVLFGAGSAEAEQQSEQKSGEASTPKKACFRVRDTRSLSAVDDRFVYVRCIRDRHYLLTMDNACLGLENSIAVAVSNRFDRVCSNDRAWITYKEFNQTRRCGILNVEEVSDREGALQLVKERKSGSSGSNGQEKAAAPEGSGSGGR